MVNRKEHRAQAIEDLIDVDARFLSQTCQHLTTLRHSLNSLNRTTEEVQRVGNSFEGVCEFWETVATELGGGVKDEIAEVAGQDELGEEGYEEEWTQEDEGEAERTAQAAS